MKSFIKRIAHFIIWVFSREKLPYDPAPSQSLKKESLLSTLFGGSAFPLGQEPLPQKKSQGIFKKIFSQEKLPQEEIDTSKIAQRKNFFSMIFSFEKLPFHVESSPQAKRKSFWRWLFGMEKLDHLDGPLSSQHSMNFLKWIFQREDIEKVDQK